MNMVGILLGEKVWGSSRPQNRRKRSDGWVIRPRFCFLSPDLHAYVVTREKALILRARGYARGMRMIDRCVFGVLLGRGPVVRLLLWMVVDKVYLVG